MTLTYPHYLLHCSFGGQILLAAAEMAIYIKIHFLLMELLRFCFIQMHFFCVP